MSGNGARSAHGFRERNRFHKASERVELFAETEMERAAVHTNHHQSDVVGRKIVGETLGDFREKRRNEFFRRNISEQFDDAQQTIFAKHSAIGVA